MRQDVMRGVPKDINAMREYFRKMFDIRTHVQGVMINPGTNNIQINLDMNSHNVGAPDVYLPIKRGKTNDARAMVEKIIQGFHFGSPPSDSEVLYLFDLVDQQYG